MFYNFFLFDFGEQHDSVVFVAFFPSSGGFQCRDAGVHQRE